MKCGCGCGKEARKGNRFIVGHNLGYYGAKKYYKKNCLAKKGRKVWNKGLTKETDERIKRYFSDGRKGEKGPTWIGGRLETSTGYIWIYFPDHPYCSKTGYVFEHRLVMEKHLGRVLLPTEVVHHINGNPGDNRIENLMLFSSNSDHMRYHKKVRMEKCAK